MDGDGVQQAFCPLLWRANGGWVDAEGRFHLLGRYDEPIRGICTRAYDCATCELMQAELATHPPGTYWWVCPDCSSQLCRRTHGRGLHLLLSGFYTEGYCQNPSCLRGEGTDRYSVILQLILGDIRKEEP